MRTLGYIGHHTGDHRRAIGYYQQALTVLRAHDPAEVPIVLDELGHPHVALGEHARARVVWREAVELYREHGRVEDAERVQQQLDTLDGTGR